MHLDHEHSLGGNHAHAHEHTHTHEHTHDGHTHTHEHSHAHAHAHEHPHNHDHLHEHGHAHDHEHQCDGTCDCGSHDHTHSHDHACSGSCAGCASHSHTPMDELLALMKYMISHNAAHARELADLAVQLEKAGSHAAYEQVMAAVSDFEKGNLRLSAVLASLDVK